MPTTPTQVHPAAGPHRDLLVLLVCLGGLLLALFHLSFASDLVVFSNDGPLGATSAQAAFAWRNVTGYWSDLNWLGWKGAGGFLSIGYLMLATFGTLFAANSHGPITLLIL